MRPSHLSAKLAWLVVCFFSLAATYCYSQSTRVTIKALTLSSTASSDGETGFEYRVNTWYNNTLNPNCIDFDNVAKNVVHSVKADDQVRVDDVPVSNVYTPLSFDFETWEDDDCKGGCSYNTDWDCNGADEAHCSRREVMPGGIQLLNFIPGSHAANRIKSTVCSGWTVEFHFAYNPVKPTITSAEYGLPGGNFTPYEGSHICSETSVKIHISNIHNDSHQPYISYTWQYWTGEYSSVPNPAYCSDPTWCRGTDPVDPPPAARVISTGVEQPEDPPCCSEPERLVYPLWRTYTTSSATTNGGTLVIPNIRDLPGVSGITSNTGVHFRALISANGLTSQYSDPFRIYVSPKPPLIGEVNTDPSCSVAATGAVRITGISGVGNYKYILREGNNFEPCNPSLGNCNSGVNSDSDISGSSETSLNIPDGTYTLIVANAGSLTGVCASTVYPVIVSAIANNRVNNFSKTDILHHGMAEGQMIFQTDGGNQGAISYSLYKSAPASPQTWDSPTENNGTKVFSALPVGTYSLTVTDGGCSPPVMINAIKLTQPKKVFEKDPAMITNATCGSPANGAVTLSVQKTNGPYDTSPPNTLDYQYQIFRDGVAQPLKEVTTESTTYNPTDLLPGSYTAKVKQSGGIDENGYTVSFIIGEPTPITVPAISTTNLTCFHDNTGAMTVSAQGGTGNFIYELADALSASFPGTGGSFSGLHAGPYYLKVKQPGCNDQLNYASPIILSEPTDINFYITHKDLNCFESGDGVVSIQSIDGGTPAIAPQSAYNSYTWEKLTNGIWMYERSSLEADQLSAGRYRFSARDAKNCLKISEAIDVGQPDALSITSLTTQHVVCYGGKGNFTITGKGGTAPYFGVYSVDNGASFKNIPSSASLGEGKYLIGIVDQHGCKVNDGAYHTITAPDAALDFTFTQSLHDIYNITCNGFTDGTIALTASGGNDHGFEGYSFSFNGNNFLSTSYFDQIGAGTYNAKVKDGRGCIINKDVVFTEPKSLNPILVDKQNVYCFGYTTGRIELEAEGGVKPYSYQLDTGGFQNSGVFTGLGAANYAVTVMDKNGCYKTMHESIESVNPPLKAQHTSKHVSCYNGADGQIAVQVSGGAGGYTFELNNVAATNPMSGITAGVYDIAITDSEGCLAEINDIILTQPAQLHIDQVAFRDIRCFGEHGAINMQVSGGVTPYKYEYTINNSAFNFFDDETQLDEGIYSLRVVDANNCLTTHPETVTITTPPTSLGYTFVKSDYNGFNVSCKGGNNGYVKLTPSGGNGSQYTGYEYAIDTRSFQSQNIIEGINAGEHTLSLRDGRGCVVEKSIFFTEAPEEMVGSVVAKRDVICVEHVTGEVELSASGGAPPYNYSRDNSSYNSSNVIGSLAPGTYTFYISDANNCRASTEAKIISLTPEMVVAHQIKDVSCYGGSDGSIEVSISSGKSPYYYQWQNLPNITEKIVAIRAGDYSVTVTDDAGCVKQGTFTITQPSLPLAASVSTTEACYAKPDGKITIIAEGGTYPYRFSVNNGDSYQNTNVFNMATGDYTITVLDSKACKTTATATINQLNITPEPDFLVATSRNALDTLVLIDISVPRPDSIHWSFDSRAQVISDNQWAPQVQFPTEGIYTVNMTGFFGGCDYLLTKTLDVKPYDPSAALEKGAGYRTILSANVSPNPTRGPFTLDVQLTKPSRITLLVYDVLGTIHYQDTRDRQEQFTQEIDLSLAASGIYVLRVIAEADASEIRLSLSK
jgi:large repetitive protein